MADGKPHETVDYHGERTVRLAVPATGGWDALTVEDRAGKTAYTNPIWVRPSP